MASDVIEVERRLWSVADQLRANSGLKPSEYSRPVLGLLFLRYADGRFAEAEKQLKLRPGSRPATESRAAYRAYAKGMNLRPLQCMLVGRPPHGGEYETPATA